MKNIVTLFIFLSVFPVVATAEAIYCTGTLDRVYIGKTGGVFIRGSWNDGYLKICNTDTMDQPVKCSLWSSYAATAVQNDIEVTVAYIVGGGQTCSTLPTGNDSLPIAYLMLRGGTE